MKNATANFVLVCASVLAGFAILEILARLFTGAPWPEQLPVVRYRPDPDVGWLMVPNDFHYTYSFPVQLNSGGFRGPEVPVKLENEYRILAIGDSMVYGQAVDDEHIMTTRLQGILVQRRPDCQVRVINMGIKGFQTNQELALLKKVGLKLNPDLVLLFFYISDFDSTDISGIYSYTKDIDWYMSDLCGKPEGKALAAWKFRQLLRRSTLIAHLYKAYTAYRSRNSTENRLSRGEDDAEIAEKIVEISGYIHEFSEISKAYAFTFGLIAIPAAAQIDHRYPQTRYPAVLKEFIDRDDIPFLDLLPSFDGDYNITRMRHQISFDGHFDARGNEIMADAVADYFTSHGWGCLVLPR